MKISALVVAGGSGKRFGSENKLLIEINGAPVIAHTLKKFEGLVDEIVLVVNPYFVQEFDRAAGSEDIVLVRGGDSRTQSVINGLAMATGDIVLIHDGARPFVSRELIKRCIADTKQYGSAIAAVKTTDSVAETAGDKITGLLPRSSLFNIQTPQGFFTAEIKKAYMNIEHEYPDDSSVYMTVGLPHMTQGEYSNHKITVQEDLQYFKNLGADLQVSPQSDNTRIGSAFDVHRLAEGRPLILGGLNVPYEKGLLGHSDADVILHAVTGAVLNGLGLKDIGTYFPDDDEEYQDADSADLLAAVLIIMKSAGYKIGNASFTVIAERPKLAPHIDAIKKSLSALLSLPVEKIGLGATTAEGLGEIGKGDSIACMGYVLLKKI